MHAPLPVLVDGPALIVGTFCSYLNSLGPFQAFAASTIGETAWNAGRLTAVRLRIAVSAPSESLKQDASGMAAGPVGMGGPVPIGSTPERTAILLPEPTRERVDAYCAQGFRVFISSYDDPQVLVLGLMAAAQDGVYFSPHISACLAPFKPENIRAVSSCGNLNALSLREGEVARLASKGLSNREIAESLFISVNTAKTHLREAFRKLAIERRSQLHGALSAAPSFPPPHVTKDHSKGRPSNTPFR